MADTAATRGNPQLLAALGEAAAASSDGVLMLQNGAVQTQLGPAVLRARYAVTTNIADLTAFTVAQDGVTGVAGDRVLLTTQTTTAQNGLYVVGAVSGGAAALTRAPEARAGCVFQPGQVCEVSEGTLFANTTWKVTTAGAITVGTTSHAWYPRRVSQSLALVAGTKTITNVPILSATKTSVLINRTVANTSTLTVGGYHPTTGGATGMTAGVVGTGQVIIEACVGAGTINNADISTLTIEIVNW